MPFNYDGLKRITNDGIVNASLTGADFADDAINSTALNNTSITDALVGTNAVTETKFADNTLSGNTIQDGAVDLSSSVIAGSAPIAAGGLGTLARTANRTVMTNNGASSLEYGFSDMISMNVYTSNSTWTRPAGCTRIKVQVVGGGGGGSGHAEAGGAGGYSEIYLDVTSISSVSVTIGNGAGGNNYHNTGGNAATSSFGPYASASGGEGARQIGGHTGGRPGIGSGSLTNGGSTLSFRGGGGSGHTAHGGGNGGTSYFGGASIGVHNNSPHTYDWESYAAPGSGGQGASNAHGRGANGRNGMVIVWNLR
jgi:hypothetical protein